MDCEYDLRTQWRGRKRAIPSSALRRHYRRTVGPLAENEHVHHTCGDPGCSNPDHLQGLTPIAHVHAHRAMRAVS